MSATEDADPPAAPASGVDQFQVLAWMDAAFAVLAQSRWAPQLDIEGVSALEALRSETMISLLRLGREGSQAATPTGTSLQQRLVQFARSAGYRVKMFAKEAGARSSAGRWSPARIVMFPTEPTHWQMMQPVVEELRHPGDGCACFTSRPKLWERLSAARVPLALTQACWPREINAARARGRRLALALPSDPGVQLPPFPARANPAQLRQIIYELLATYLPTVVEARTIADLLLDRVQPGVIMVGNDITLEGRVISTVAQTRGVATVTSQHGNVAGNPLHGRHLVDRLLLFGEASHRVVRAYGQGEQQLAVTGPTHLDQRPQQSGQVHALVRERLKIDGARPYVLGLLSGARQNFSLRHHLAQVEALAQASAALPDIELVAKLHRVDLTGYYTAAQQRVSGARLHVVAYGAAGYPDKIFDWLQGCRLVITGASTAAVEAMLMQVPVITMDLCNELKGVDFIDAGATWHVRSAADLPAAVRTLLDGGPQAQAIADRAATYLTDCYGPLDGKAASRAADLIRQLARRSG
ncbi:MAG: UDP-N-acetylglucosamine 2-epimerase [Pirellulales bacterium]|nr:UDP-N-acetylglucosamine 2-epimerase [Pirellulales bacterium]